MITEDYVSYEIAKLLKEKGFDEETRTKYKGNGSVWDNIRYDGKWLTNSQLFPQEFSAPTHQMAMKWLREVHNIDIEVHAEVGMLGVKVYVPMISRYKSETANPSKLRQYKHGVPFKDDKGIVPALQYFDKYEEAVEAALKYTLENLI